MRRLITGDIHARFDALQAVLEKAAFNKDEDILYCVGDLCDRGEKPAQTLAFLSSLPNFRPVMGNHDVWLEEYLLTGLVDSDWLYNGGVNTIRNIEKAFSPAERRSLGRWMSSFPIIRIEENDIIVHGGCGPVRDMKELEMLAGYRRPSPFEIRKEEDRILFEILWDRDYLFSAIKAERYETPGKYRNREYRTVPPLETDKTIWSGHSQLVDKAEPFISPIYHLNAIDTGAGSGLGKLTLMDMDSREVWQAEIA